mmetsp:Transcript_658/g.1198  ORF Transcript_658/g.1198 Transcript_658/m.1198 type:complete len:334 (-) Transcript_658:504-1505(-)
MHVRGGVRRGGARLLYAARHCLQVLLHLLLELQPGGAPPRGLRHRRQVGAEEQRGEREHELDPGQLQALPQVQAPDREEPRVHAHDVLLPLRVLLALPRALVRPRRAHRRVLRLQPVRPREAARGVRRDAEAAGHGQALAGEVHALLRALGGSRKVPDQGPAGPARHHRRAPAAALPVPEHARLPAQVRHRCAGADRGVPQGAQMVVRVRLLRGHHGGAAQLFRVHAGRRGAEPGDADSHRRAGSGPLPVPGPAVAPEGRRPPPRAGLALRPHRGHLRAVRRLPIQAHRAHRHHQKVFPNASFRAGEGAAVHGGGGGGAALRRGPPILLGAFI